MQMILQLIPRKPLVVPFNYNYQIQSAIYHKLKETETSDFWHDVGFGDEKKFKAFSFGSIRGRYAVENNHIYFADRVSLEIRSPLFEFCDDLQRAFELRPEIKLFDTVLDVENATVSNVHINRSSVVFTTQTPITVYQHDSNGYTRYFSPDEPEFYTGICNNFERKFEAVFQTTPPCVQIRCHEAKQYKKVVTKYKGTVINAYHGTFEVKGTPIALETLYNMGLGAKNSQGFGFVHIPTVHNIT